MRDHRQNVRIPSDEIIDCYHGQGHFEAEILDLSRGGIRIGCLQDLPLGSSILIQHRELSRCQIPVKAVARWKRPGAVTEIGLEFQAESKSANLRWVAELFPDEGPLRVENLQQRLDVRADVSIPVVTDIGGMAGETLDVSSGGARFRVNAKLEDETSLLFCLPDSFVEVQARVLRRNWQHGQWIHSVRFQELKEEQKALLSSQVNEWVACPD